MPRALDNVDNLMVQAVESLSYGCTVTLLGETEINSAVNEVNLNIYVSITYIENDKVDM